MDTSTLSIALTGVVPSVCDAEAGDESCIGSRPLMDLPTDSGTGSYAEAAIAAQMQPGKHGLSLRDIRSAMSALCSAIRSALDDERSTAEDSLRRAAEILREMGETGMSTTTQARGGLAPWQIRKVTSHVEANLDRTIRNADLAALVRLNASHFGRAFHVSFGEPPHEYVIRRRVERAQGLMLSTDAPLSEIALDCGLADQAHLSRLFRRIVGETPRAWRRARLGEPAEQC